MKRIGIVGDREKFENYYRAVRTVGAMPVSLITEEELQTLDTLDGVVIPGGVDVNPALYGEENTASVNIDDRLDQFEMRLIPMMKEKGLPILGICRGMQILNVCFGGSLIQNIDHAEMHRRDDRNVDRAHSSEILPGTFLDQVYHTRHIPINSAHHQAVRRLAEGFKIAQYSDADHVVEAIYHESLPIYGVQWHPERMYLQCHRICHANGLHLFRYFVDHIVP